MVWPIPSLPSYSGPYSVGSIDLEVAASDLVPQAPSLVPETVSCRVYYPAETPSKSHSNRSVYWIQSPQRGTVSAYGRFLQLSPTLANVFSFVPQFLYYITIPVLRNAQLLTPTESSGRWPVVVFSHGLGGTRNTYSYLCGQLASYGLVVCALDHRDGSSPVQYIRATENTKARTEEYRKISHAPSKETYDARDDQLKIRLSECSMIYEALLRMDKGAALNNLDPNHGQHKAWHTTSSKTLDKKLLDMFAGKLDVQSPGKITWAGHSFGAATSIQFVKSVFYHPSIPSPLLLLPPSDALKAQITPRTPVILLDPWGFPLTSTSTAALMKQPMPSFSNASSNNAGSPQDSPSTSPILAILSSSFYNWTGNLNQIKAALSDPAARQPGRKALHAPAHMFYPLNSAHLSQSDFGLLFPNITKYVARAAEPERTLRLNVRAILEVLRRTGIEVARTTEVDMELSGEKQSEGSDMGDPRILSSEEGAVSGWISIKADEVGDEDGDLTRVKGLANASPSEQGRRVEQDKDVDAKQQDSLGDDELSGARRNTPHDV